MMTIKNWRNRFVLCILLFCMCVLLTGCPSPMDTRYIENGEAFKNLITGNMYYMYGVQFKDTTVEAVIEYQTDDGSKKTAAFQLDGYDQDKKIGFKVVLEDNKNQWEADRQEGKLKAPDINDYNLIQAQAIKNETPIIFMQAYQYQGQLDEEQAKDNLNEFHYEFNALLDTKEMILWLENGLYSGEWIKERLEDSYRNSVHSIEFAHNDLPMVTIEYGMGKKAVFHLDGYDAEKEVGYIFVTAEVEEEWKQQREEGDLAAPNLLYSESIQRQSLYYNFPVIFIYQPEYWKMKINQVIDYDMDTFTRLEEWLGQHE